MILKILCCLIPELLHSQTWTAGHLSSGVTATPYQPFTAEGEKKNYRQLWQSDQLFTLKLGLQYFTCTVHTFTDSVYIF